MEKIKLLIFKIIQIITFSNIFWNRKEGVYLSFDDGPDPKQTLVLLEILRKYGAKATFFVQGNNAEKFPDILKEIRKDGHTLANHTYSHIRYENNFTEYYEDLKKCETVIGQNNSGSKYFRITYGTVSLRLFFALLLKGHKIAFWNKDTKDYKLKDLNDLSNYMDINTIRNGDVILLHDYPEFTSQILEKILQTHTDKKFLPL